MLYEENKKLKKLVKLMIKLKYCKIKGTTIKLGIKGYFKELLINMDDEIKTLEDELSALLKTKQKLLIPGMMTAGQTGGDEESILKRDNITRLKVNFKK